VIIAPSSSTKAQCSPKNNSLRYSMVARTSSGTVSLVTRDQLPPIGPGRPFVDLVNYLAPTNVETLFPRYAPGYAELTVPRRQRTSNRKDALLAAHFSGRPLEPGADEVWDSLVSGKTDSLRAVQWTDPKDLQRKLIAELVQAR
jgi:hypothetical protein